LKPYLNFHTHQAPSSATETGIYNLLIQEIDDTKIADNQRVSAGVHPWYAHPTQWRVQLAQVAALALRPQVVAIGECGLDKLIGPSLEVQLPLFEAQVQLAQSLQKPVVVHCVKAFNELLSWKKCSHVTVPMVLHGFNNKPEVAAQLLQHGFYVSLGAALLREDSNAQKALKIIPLERLFLENDAQQTPIQNIYAKAATLLNIEIEVLTDQIWRNFANIS
jgi:TatD DNase family protein